jgi:hypothetical protein
MPVPGSLDACPSTESNVAWELRIVHRGDKDGSAALPTSEVCRVFRRFENSLDDLGGQRWNIIYGSLNYSAG